MTAATVEMDATAGPPAGQPPPGRSRPSRRRRAGRSRPSRRRRWLRNTLIAFASIVVLSSVVLWLAWRSLPEVADAQERVDRILLQHDGRRTALASDAKVVRAVLAVEDARFFSHSGVDPLAVVRAAWGTVRGADDPGGATISQQLAKVLYTGDGGWGTKLKQVGIALKLERSYTKGQILDMYLNAIYYGAGHYGIESAATGYFGVGPEQLTWAQASLVAGLPQAPSAYDPTKNLALAKRRQRHVLDRLVATGALSASDADAAYVESLPF